MSSVGSFFSYVNDARSHEPEGMEINPVKSKAIRFTGARVKSPLGYSLDDQKILEARSFKKLGIIL